MTTWYDAVFDDGQQLRTVGPFDSSGEADEYGANYHGEQLDYVGWALRTGRAELSQVVGALAASPAGSGPGWSGVITRWNDGATFGFITDSEQRSWFVSRDDLPAGCEALAVGEHVRFAGDPNLKPGKNYPRAYTVRIAEADADPTP